MTPINTKTDKQVLEEYRAEMRQHKYQWRDCCVMDLFSKFTHSHDKFDLGYLEAWKDLKDIGLHWNSEQVFDCACARFGEWSIDLVIQKIRTYGAK